MAKNAEAQDHVFQSLTGNAAAINRLADNYEKVAKHLQDSQKRLDGAADDLQHLKGKNFDALQAHVGRLLAQYAHAASHFTKAVVELRQYAKQLEIAQEAARSARTRYLAAVSTLGDAFTGSTTPVPTHLMHPATYPDATVDVTGWPLTALGVAHALDAARADWHQAAAHKKRAAGTAHDGIDSSALLQNLGNIHDSAGSGQGAGGKAAAGAAAVAVAMLVRPGSKAAKKQNARKDYRSAVENIKNQFKDTKANLNQQIAEAKKSGDTARARELEARLDLANDRERHQLDVAKERRDDRIDRANGKYDAAEERQEAHHDAHEAKALANREYRLDKADAEAAVAKAQAAGDPIATRIALQHAQLVEARHKFQTHAADAHVQSSLAHIALHQHPNVEAAHHLLQHDKQLANANFHERAQLADTNFRLNSATIQHRLEAAHAAGDTDLVHQLEQHQHEVQQAHQQHLAELKQNHAERIDNLQHDFERAHPLPAAHLVAGKAEFVSIARLHESPHLQAFHEVLKAQHGVESVREEVN